jgi:hypothetical protein
MEARGIPHSRKDKTGRRGRWLDSRIRASDEGSINQEAEDDVPQLLLYASVQTYGAGLRRD